MKLIQVDEKQIKGISVRMTNANEFNPETSKIAALYQQFDETVRVDYKNGALVYSVYYESDHSNKWGQNQIVPNITMVLKECVKMKCD